MKIKLGSVVKDLVTEAEGIVTSYTKYLTGCDSIGITRKGVNNDGKPYETIWIDVNRAKVLSGPDSDMQQVINSSDKGGPQEPPQRNR